jgi:hypothetical protein
LAAAFAASRSVLPIQARRMAIALLGHRVERLPQFRRGGIHSTVWCPSASAR